MLKNTIFPLALTLIGVTLFSLQFLETDKPFLILNMEDKSELPKNFRLIPELFASGSGQFSEKSLKKILETIPSSKVRIIDLREESHGFIDGMAVSWFVDNNCANLGKTLAEIEEDETVRLNKLLNLKSVTVYTRAFVPINVNVSQVATEKELSLKYGTEYLRLPVTDHRRPTDGQIDRYIQMVKELPEDIWLHFHCLGGRGRTTSFLAMLDMMKNAGRFNLEQIAERQESFGGLNILKPPSKLVWKYPYIIERIEFVKLFYQYCLDVPNFDIPWSEWIKNPKPSR